MDAPVSLTETELVAILFDAERRRALAGAMTPEQDPVGTLSQSYERLVKTLPIDSDALGTLVGVLMEEASFDLLEPLVWHAQMPDDALMRMCEAGCCISALGHRNLPKQVLRRFVELHAYPEAVLTLGMELFSDPSISTEEFESFLATHEASEWLLRTLAARRSSERLTAASSPEKERLFLDALVRHPVDWAVSTIARRAYATAVQTDEAFEAFLREHANEASTLEALLREPCVSEAKEACVLRAVDAHEAREGLLVVRQRVLHVREASSATLDEARAHVLLALSFDDVDCALAANPSVPDAILEAMTERRDAPHAHTIRTRAQATLRAKQKAAKSHRPR